MATRVYGHNNNEITLRRNHVLYLLLSLTKYGESTSITRKNVFVPVANTLENSQINSPYNAYLLIELPLYLQEFNRSYLKRQRLMKKTNIGCVCVGGGGGKGVHVISS